MNLYAESSAVLAWLLEERSAREVSSCLDSADVILSSALTLVECDRTLLRYAFQGHLTEAARADLAARVAIASAHWTQLAITDSILNRARLRFHEVPVRTLDAIHLSSALEGRAVVPDLVLLTLDERMRTAARSLGLRIAPE